MRSFFEPDVEKINSNFNIALEQGQFTHGTLEQILLNLNPFLDTFHYIALFSRDDVKYIIEEIKKPTQKIDREKLTCFFNELQAKKYSPFFSYDIQKSKIRNRIAITDIISSSTKLTRIQTFQALQKDGFSTLQRINADGNCYYRAIIKGYIEHTIMETPEKRAFFFQRLANLFQGEILDKPPFEDYRLTDAQNKDIATLIQKIRLAAEGLYWKSLQAFWQELADDKTQTDMLLILCSRYLVAQACINNHLLIAGAATEFNIDNIVKLDTYAEDHPNVSLLPKILAFPCDVIGIDSELYNARYTDAKFTPVECQKYPVEYAFSNQNQYHLVFIEDHYDALIHQELEEKMQAFEHAATIRPTLIEETQDQPNCLWLLLMYLWEYIKCIFFPVYCCIPTKDASPQTLPHS
jgi:hypothetical protein